MNSLQPPIIESAQLMLIGMGTVFVILIMLIFLTTLVSKTLTRFNLVDPPQPPSRRAAKAAKTDAATSNNELIAVISSAIKAHKKRHSNL